MPRSSHAIAKRRRENARTLAHFLRSMTTPSEIVTESGSIVTVDAGDVASAMSLISRAMREVVLENSAGHCSFVCEQSFIARDISVTVNSIEVW